MINCRNCVHWIDEGLEDIEADRGSGRRLLMGCRIYGYLPDNHALESCDQYVESDNLFCICSTCSLTVPKVCISLRECTNCTDTDLFCLESCIGGDRRKYCSHFVRLHHEGVTLIHEGEAFDLFPNQDMHRKRKDGD
ncbi:MAG: hypothetical protein ABIG68_14835 [Acidobacteriota bacterium]